MPHAEPLFFRPRLEFQKTAAEIPLPPDAAKWQLEILQELHKHIPYIADFDPQVVLDRVDAERGYAIGHISVTNKTDIQANDIRTLESAGLKEVRIPVIVKGGKLQPLDLLVSMGSGILPLTEMRLRRALFRPQRFDTTGKTPGDVSLVAQLYPPYRQNYGMGGGGGAVVSGGAGGEKTGSDKAAGVQRFRRLGESVEKALVAGKTPQWEQQMAYLDAGEKVTRRLAKLPKPSSTIKISSVLSGISRHVTEEDLTAFADKLASNRKLAQALLANPASRAAVERIQAIEPLTSEKIANAVRRDAPNSALSIRRLSEGDYEIKTASASWWSPCVGTVDRGTLVRTFGAKIALAADTKGAVTATVGPAPAAAEPPSPAPAETYGLYQVETAEGESVVGFVFPNLIDLDGQPMPIALFTNGAVTAVQGEICGTPVGTGAALFEGNPSGAGAFYTSGADGSAQAMIPMTLDGRIGEGGDIAFAGTTYDGRPVKVVVTHEVDSPTLEGATCLVPDMWKWMPLDGAKAITVASCPPDQELKTATAVAEGRAVYLRGDSTGAFSFEGPAVAKLAANEREHLSIGDSLFLLAGCGVDQEVARAKLASAFSGVRREVVWVGRGIDTPETATAALEPKIAAYLSQPSLRQDLLKEAAEIPDPLAVDTVLSLGFLNPENVHTFIAFLPHLETAQTHLCELLLAARLGLKEVAEGAIERASRSLEIVLEGLRSLAFQ